MTSKTEKGPRRPALTRKVMRGLTHLYDRFDCTPYQERGRGDERGDIEAAFAWINSQLERRGMEHDPEPRRIPLRASCETDTEPPAQHTTKTYGPGTRSHEVAERVVRDANERAAAAAATEGGGA